MIMKCIISRLRRLLGFALLNVFVVGLLVTPTAVALDSEYLDFFTQNDILFYDPTCNNYTTYAGSVAVSGDTVEEKVWSGLTSFLTPEQAAGAMGNISHEGNMNPVLNEQIFKDKGIDIFTNTQKAYGVGLVQWSFGRRVSMLEYVVSANPSLRQYFFGHSYNWDYADGETFYSQLRSEIGDDNAEIVANALIALELEFLQSEIQQNSEYSGLMNTNSVEDAAAYFLYHVEQPANARSKEAERVRDAKNYYERFSGSTSGGSGGSGTSSSCNNSVGLSSGGFNSVEEAESVIINPYNNNSLSNLSLLTPATGDRHHNCVAFSIWFVSNYTNIEIPNGSIPGDGRDIAQNFYNGWVGKYPELSISNEPSVYSIASWKVAGEFTRSGNHTGVVVGIDKENDKILVAEAGWNSPNFTGVHEHKLSLATNNNYYYVNINAYMQGNLAGGKK